MRVGRLLGGGEDEVALGEVEVAVQHDLEIVPGLVVEVTSDDRDLLV
jgi:hypothetical protein